MYSVEEMPGAREAIDLFHQHGAITAIVTGGFKELADRIQRRYKIHHALAGCEYFFHPVTRRLDHWNLLPADYKGKTYFIKAILREYNISRKDCAFIGDAKNDVSVAREVGISIAFNAQPELKEVCTYVIDQNQGNEDFIEVANCFKNIEL